MTSHSCLLEETFSLINLVLSFVLTSLSLSLFAGAKHLYLLDFNGENLPNLKETIQKRYPDVKVDTFEGDAADEKLIEKICNQSIQDEGRLDIFHANAAIATAAPLVSTDGEDLMETQRVNVLRLVAKAKSSSSLPSFLPSQLTLCDRSFTIHFISSQLFPSDQIRFSLNARNFFFKTSFRRFNHSNSISGRFTIRCWFYGLFS